MRLKLTPSDLQRILRDNPDIPVTKSDPWYIIVAKIVAYVLGLLLAGYATPDIITSLGTSIISIV